jgi:hypothetical protein
MRPLGWVYGRLHSRNNIGQVKSPQDLAHRRRAIGFRVAEKIACFGLVAYDDDVPTIRAGLATLAEAAIDENADRRQPSNIHGETVYVIQVEEDRQLHDTSL